MVVKSMEERQVNRKSRMKQNTNGRESREVDSKRTLMSKTSEHNHKVY